MDSLRKIIREQLEQLEEVRSTSLLGIAGDIGRHVPNLETMDIKSLASGMVGLYKSSDGNVYEIEITPGASIKDKSFWGDVLTKNDKPLKGFKRAFDNLGLD